MKEPNPAEEMTPQELRDRIRAQAFSQLGGKDDPHFQDHGGNWTLDRIEANEDWYESLRDDGRSDGQGESYAERNV
jgi:hypothetical protein